MKTIQSVATEINKQFEYKERTDGTKYYCLKDEHPEWMRELIHAVHGDKLPDDTTYEFIADAVDILSELSEQATEDDARDRISEIEADVYTSDLTGWLNRRNDHVYYITQALDEFGPFDDGFKLLATAQYLHKQEVANDVLAQIIKHIEGRRHNNELS